MEVRGLVEVLKARGMAKGTGGEGVALQRGGWLRLLPEREGWVSPVCSSVR